MSLALIMAKHENADIDKVLKMALIHDITESRNGDVNYQSRLYVDKKEELAIDDILKSTSLEEEWKEIWNEYEERKSLESKIVKDADILDQSLEKEEQAAKGNKEIKEVFKDTEKFYYYNLQTNDGKKIYGAMQSVGVHDWHVKGRNVYTESDKSVFEGIKEKPRNN
ncbi:MAG: HD domain-containing protein [bacterium]